VAARGACTGLTGSRGWGPCRSWPARAWPPPSVRQPARSQDISRMPWRLGPCCPLTAPPPLCSAEALPVLQNREGDAGARKQAHPKLSASSILAERVAPSWASSADIPVVQLQGHGPRRGCAVCRGLSRRHRSSFPRSRSARLLLPKLAEGIAEAQSFLLLIGPNDVLSDWVSERRHILPASAAATGELKGTSRRRSGKGVDARSGIPQARPMPWALERLKCPPAPTITRWLWAVASPARTRSTTCAVEKPCARKIASVQPSGEAASNSRARRRSGPDSIC
jgi:hypothetical protein